MDLRFLLAMFFALQGALVGSFLNVLTERIPEGRGVGGRSTCDGCGRRLSAYELVPVFSYLVQRGRSVCCKKSLSIQYPIVELATAIIFTLVAISHTTTRTFGMNDILKIFVLCIIASVSLSIVIVDSRHHLIPDGLQIALLIGVILYHTFSASLTVMIMSEGLIVALPILFLYLVTGGRGMGFGDVKLQMILGVWLGITKGLVGLYIAFVIGAGYGVILMLMRKADRKTAIAFGPFLLAGAWVSYYCFDWLRYLWLLVAGP